MLDADNEVDTKRAIKALQFPAMDDDGLPSSYIQRVLGALSKWRLKMNAMVDTLNDLETPAESVTKFLK